jgi:iron complex outermembrane recepter protein
MLGGDSMATFTSQHKAPGRRAGVIASARRALIPGTSLLTLLGATPMAAHADPDVLDEIVVTAQKREEKLQDVPISISAISGDALASEGAHDFREVLLSIPGLSYSGTEPGQSNYSIRGVSTGASSPTTGLYLDDVSVLTIATNFSGTEDLPLFDLDRIEVLKGPQGTLYGGSAMGGAIKYVTRQPDLDHFGVSVAGGVATTDGGAISYNGESILNAPIIDGKVGMRIGVMYRDDGGYIDYLPNAPGVWLNRSATNPPAAYSPLPFASDGTVNETDANTTRNTSGRISFKVALDNGLTLVPQATIQRIYEAAPPWYWANLPNFESAARMAQPTHDNLNLFSLPITQPLGPVTLTSLTAYWNRARNWDRDYTFFIAGLIPALLGNDSANYSDTDTKSFSQELRIASSDPHSAFKWVAGVLYQHQTDQLTQIINTVGAGVVFATGTDNTYTGIQATKTTQYAAFGDLTYSFTSQWDASVGLRYFDIDQSYDANFIGVLNGGTTEISGKHSADVGFNPKFSITYRPLDDHMLYATASKGFRPGGPNRFNTASPLCAPDFANLGISSAPASFTSDKLWTYELGSKNSFNSGRTVANAAIFYTDWKDIQQQVNLPTCGFQFIGNVGTASIKGGELELRSILVTGVTGGAVASYTKSEITSTAPGVSAQVGQPLLDTPKWTSSIYLEFELPIVAGWESHIRTDYSYHGSNIRQFDTTSLVTLPNGNTTLDSNLGMLQHAYKVGNAAIESQKGQWQLRLYVDNITNTAPIIDDLSQVFNTPNVTTLRPRTVGVLVRTKF